MMEFTAKDEPVMPSPETTTRRMTSHVRSGMACGIWENIRRLEDFFSPSPCPRPSCHMDCGRAAAGAGAWSWVSCESSIT